MKDVEFWVALPVKVACLMALGEDWMLQLLLVQNFTALSSDMG